MSSAMDDATANSHSLSTPLGDEAASMRTLGHHTTFSDIDSSRFGWRIARNSQMTADEIASADSFCKHEQIDLLIARCPTSDLTTLLRLQADDYHIMDTLVRWRYQLQPSHDVVRLPVTSVQQIDATQADAAAAIARAAFQTYDGHYHADPRLQADHATEVYASWAAHLCQSTRVEDVMLAAQHSGSSVGFIALTCADLHDWDVPLAAVAPTAQGQGVFTTMLEAAIDIARSGGGTTLDYGCVLTNIGAQKALARLGFEISASFYTFHKWFTNSK